MTKLTTQKYKIQPKNEQRFVYKQRKQKLDWRKLVQLDLDDIIQNNSVEKIEAFAENVCFCNVDKETGFDVDPNFTKLFQIAQLAMEHLLFQKSSWKAVEENALSERDLVVEKNHVLAQENKELQIQVHQLQKELKTVKQTLHAMQLTQAIPQAQAGAVVEYYRCKLCPKAFASKHYLESHEKRRHLLEMEQEDKPNELDRVAQMIESFSQKLLDKERKEKEELELKERQRLLETSVMQEKLRFEEELVKLKSAVYQELDDERKALREERNAFEKLVSAQTKTLSHVGNLEDDEEEQKPSEVDVLKQQHEQLMQQLQQELVKQMQQMDEQLKREHDLQRRLWEQQMHQAAQEIQSLRNALVQPKHHPERVQEPVRIQKQTVETTVQPFQTEIIQETAVEQIQEIQETIEETVVETVKKPVWKDYLQILKQEQITPSPCGSAFVRSKLQHDHDSINQQKDRQMNQLNDFFEAVQVYSVNDLTSETETQIQDALQALQQQLKQPFTNDMKAYLMHQLDDIAEHEFKMRDLPPLPRKSSIRSQESPVKKSVHIVENTRKPQIVTQEPPIFSPQAIVSKTGSAFKPWKSPTALDFWKIPYNWGPKGEPSSTLSESPDSVRFSMEKLQERPPSPSKLKELSHSAKEKIQKVMRRVSFLKSKRPDPPTRPPPVPEKDSEQSESGRETTETDYTEETEETEESVSDVQAFKPLVESKPVVETLVKPSVVKESTQAKQIQITNPDDSLSSMSQISEPLERETSESVSVFSQIEVQGVGEDDQDYLEALDKIDREFKSKEKSIAQKDVVILDDIDDFDD